MYRDIFYHNDIYNFRFCSFFFQKHIVRHHIIDCWVAWSPPLSSGIFLHKTIRVSYSFFYYIFSFLNIFLCIILSFNYFFFFFFQTVWWCLCNGAVPIRPQKSAIYNKETFGEKTIKRSKWKWRIRSRHKILFYGRNDWKRRDNGGTISNVDW